MSATTESPAPDQHRAWPPANPPEPTYVDDRLNYWAEATPDAEAMTYLGRTWTWREWHERVHRAAGGLRDLGIARGDVVSFLDKNHPACVEISLAAGSIGAANAIINWRSAGDEIDYAVNDSGAKVLFVGRESMPTIEAIRDRLPNVERIIEVTPEGGEDDAYEQFLAASTACADGPDVLEDDVCLVMYSSGTTGRPKGVMLTHRNMVKHTVNSHDGWVFEPGDKSMVAMPLFHVGGSSYVLMGIHDGVPSVMTREPDAASLAGAILAGANRTFLVPAVLAQVLQAGPDAVKPVRPAQDLHLRRRADAAAAAARCDGGLAGHRLHPGLRPHRGGRRRDPPDARGPPHRRGRRPPRAAGLRRQADPRGRGAHRRPRDPHRRGRRRARRDLAEDPAGDEGLPQQARGDRRGRHRGRLVPHRRHGPRRRGRLRLRLRPAQGHDHHRR
ncbi:AMP-binding protein [Nocardioides convexus]|uniref:AMP-binding protein n=1 Tax=Nocardioides convexus TaxID=2712224 RepID=UPI0024184ADA|nr:AMP-binding protein [Nocardioides convexus]